MSKKSSNSNLRKADKGKNDEFYTQLADIERELAHYTDHFRDKVVLCNCDDPRISNFFHYFAYNFEYLGLKKLITTCYKNKDMNLFTSNQSEKAIYLEYTGDKNGDNTPSIDEIGVHEFEGDGDFRSDECIELLKQADIVVTNPPFSLFREYISQLIEYNKKFIVVGNMNAISYKEIFKLIKENKIWSGNGFNLSMVFKSPYENTLEANLKFCEQKGYFGKNYIKTPAINRYTNLDYKRRHEDLILYKTYYGNENEYPKYDHYDAINIDKVKDIPMDYEGKIGVPITFLGSYNPNQFEIIDGLNRYSILDGPTKETQGKYLSQISGKPIYIRIIIKKRTFNY